MRTTKEKKKNIKMLCPKCKGKLVKRNGKYECKLCGSKFKEFTGKENETKKKTANVGGVPEFDDNIDRFSESEEEERFRKSMWNGMLPVMATLAVSIVLVVVVAAMTTPALARENSKKAKEETIKEEVVELENGDNTVSEPVAKPTPEPAPETEETTEPTPSTDGRIHSMMDISEDAIDSMVNFTANDLRSKFAIKSDALALAGEAIDTRYPTVVPANNETEAHPLTWWINPPKAENGETEVEASPITIDRIIAYDSYLIQNSADNPDEGTIKILYKVEFSVSLPYVVMPGESDVIQDAFYVSYSYPVNLADKEHFIADYTMYSFDGKEYVDIDKGNWELKHIVNDNTGFVLLDEYVPAKG